MLCNVTRDIVCVVFPNFFIFQKGETIGDLLLDGSNLIAELAIERTGKSFVIFHAAEALALRILINRSKVSRGLQFRNDVIAAILVFLGGCAINGEEDVGDVAFRLAETDFS